MSPLGVPTLNFQNLDLSQESWVGQGSLTPGWDLEDVLLLHQVLFLYFSFHVAYALRWSQFTPRDILPVTSLTE